MRLGKETIEHLARDTGLDPAEIDEEQGPSVSTSSDSADHLAKDTGVPADELSDHQSDPTGAMARAMPPD